MKFWSKVTLAFASVALLSLSGVRLSGQAPAQGKAATQGKAQGKAETPAKAAAKAGGPAKVTAGEFFKNVTTPTLKDLTPDDFILAMGLVADNLGLDCADCHPGAGSDKVDWVIDTPQKKTARKMIEMVGTINKTNFAGVQMVTCWTCHHGRDRPATTIALDAVYSTPNSERDDLVTAVPGQSAAAILDKYIAALGGAQRLAGITSFIATGKSVGYEGLGGTGEFNIYAKSPNMKTTEISFKDHPDRGKSIWAFNGRTGWITTPRGLLGEYEVTGTGLDGVRFDAQMAFPGQIKTLFTNWRVGQMETLGDRDFNVIQGGTARGLLVTLYFDTKTNLLSRMIVYTSSPIGRAPQQVDFDDYRDVGGVKFPFKDTFLWLDGRWTAEISSIKTNVAIDAAKFGKP
ncbi:MAG: photosynthetic reaction center cytochrome c subunit [Acidobacteriia bacterium]|nr:photosynthetic reaction center cytochrome c subunit [Terriglobia bacterium]